MGQYRCHGTICRRWPRGRMLGIWGYDTMTVEERVAASSGIERLEAEAGPHVRRAPVRLRMTERASELDAAELADDMGDDTTELALTEEDMRTLSRAAE